MHINRLFLSIILFTLLTSSSLINIVNASSMDSWEVKASFPKKGEVVNCAVAVNGKIYAIGNLFNYEYDPVTDTWVEKTLMPTPRSSFGFAVYHDKIYTLGGTMLNQENETVYSDVIEVYDPSTDVWENKKPMPLISASLNQGTFTVCDKIHLVIGQIHTIYDPEAESWTTGASVPNSDYKGSSSTVFDDKIYFFNPNQTQIYQPTNDTWSFGTPLPSYFASASCCATTGNMAPKRIYVFGGWISAFETSDTTLIYNPETNAWKFGTPMISGRVGPACAVVDDRMYLIGGFAHAFLVSSANHQYIPIEYIPEFSSLIVLPLTGAVMLVVIIYRKNTAH